MRNSKNRDLVRLWKLQAKVNKLVLDGKRTPKRVAHALQEILEESVSEFKLYLHPRQKEGGTIRGFDLLKHFEETGDIDRAYSLDSPLVKGWIERSETYPCELTDKGVCLWGSQQESKVPYLAWSNDRVIVLWYPLELLLSNNNPALLEPEQSEALQGQASSSEL